MKTVVRRGVCVSVVETNPTQFFPIEWCEVDIEFEKRRAIRSRRLGLVLATIAIVSGIISVALSAIIALTK